MDRDAKRLDQNGQVEAVNQRRSPAKEAFWRKALADQRRSGQTVRVFCQDRHLSEPSFYAWRAELARRDAAQHVGQNDRLARRGPRSSRGKSPTSFVSLKVAQGGEQPSGDRSLYAIELILRSGARLRVPAGCDKATFEMVLAALEGHLC